MEAYVDQDDAGDSMRGFTAGLRHRLGVLSADDDRFVGLATAAVDAHPRIRLRLLWRQRSDLMVFAVPVLVVGLVGALTWVWWCVLLVVLAIWLSLRYRRNRRRRRARQQIVAVLGPEPFAASPTV